MISVFWTNTVGKELTPYILSFSTPLHEIGEKLRKELEVRYRGNPIKDLCEIQFLIANTGHRPIRDIINPLQLVVPAGCTLLDARVLHVDPRGRSVTILSAGISDPVVFDTPLLNAGEFFVLKILMNGNVRPERMIFKITADEIPPSLKPEFLPPDAVSCDEKER